METGAVPSFMESSSPELDDILSRFRSKVFLPAHLSKQHKDLIYRSRHQKLLSTEPVSVNISGEDFRLEHIDRTKDIPDTVRGIWKAISLMQNKNDWDNLAPLLEGLKDAKKELKPWFWSKLIRTAGRAGRLDIVLELARRSSSTGFVLREPTIVAELMWWIQYKATNNNWTEKQTKQALTWAEMVIVLLEDPKHSGNKAILGDSDPRTLPEVIGVLLQLSSIRAARHLDGKDEDGKVAEYAERLIGTSLDKTFGVNPVDSDSLPDVYEKCAYLRAIAPVLHGMKVAQQVLDPKSEVTQQLKSKIPELESLAAVQRTLILELLGEDVNLPLAVQHYDKLFDSGSLQNPNTV